MSALLAHPLVVLLVGAALTGILVPALTRRWQDRQKELDIKASLVSELSEAIMSIVMAVQFVRVRAERAQHGLVDTFDEKAKEKRQEEFSEAYRTWEVRSAVLGTKLEAYFPDTTIPSDWTTFSDVVTRFYALEGVREHHRQEGLTRLLEQMLPSLSHEERFRRGWPGLKEAILKKKSEIIRNVLNSRISAFRAGLPI
jgi:hypothetical protein